jgi:broad specificity phosphatase PhoE
MTTEWPSSSRNSIESKEVPPYGANIEMTIKMMRHGQRTPEGALTDSGRATTKERATESELGNENFDAIKAYGSNLKPQKESGMGRALETASIYANSVYEDQTGIPVTPMTPRANNNLNYEIVSAKPPFDHDAIVKANLPNNFETLDQEEKGAAMMSAQSAAAREELALTTLEAMEYRKEMAGSHAHALNHYRAMAKRLKSGSTVLLPLGTHGTMIEYLLMEALVHKGENDEEITGTNDVEDLGGEFNTSDAYTIHVKTDEEGKEKVLRVTFDQGDKKGQEFRLDIHKLDELDEAYTKLHNK